MPTLASIFLNLPDQKKKAVHIDLCKQALQIWNDHCDSQKSLGYVETVCGTKQVVDRDLPTAAFRAVIAGSDSENVAYRYQEPIAAMQDDDLRFPDDIELAYYAIYNLFRRYVSSRIDDDWLIVNQALSAHGEGSDYASILEAAISHTGEQIGGADPRTSGGTP